MTSPFTEDTLVQQTTASYLDQQLGWRSVYAYNREDFGPDSLPVSHYSEQDVRTRADGVYQHVFRVYPRLPSPYYEMRMAA